MQAEQNLLKELKNIKLCNLFLTWYYVGYDAEILYLQWKMKKSRENYPKERCARKLKVYLGMTNIRKHL